MRRVAVSEVRAWLWAAVSSRWISRSGRRTWSCRAPTRTRITRSATARGASHGRVAVGGQVAIDRNATGGGLLQSGPVASGGRWICETSDSAGTARTRSANPQGSGQGAGAGAATVWTCEERSGCSCRIPGAVGMWQ